MRSANACLRILVLCFVASLASCGDDDAPPPAGGDGGRDAGVDGSPPPVPDGGDAGPSGCSGDTDCDNGVFCDGTELCDPDNPAADPDGCIADPDGRCLAGQSCDEATEACITDCAVARDADGDGVDAMECGGPDCDDSDRDTYPGNTEVCDIGGHDEDCNTATFGDRDLDGDTIVDAACCNGAVCGSDCNDLSRSTHPTASEVCDGFDNNCDGVVDEGVRSMMWRDADFDLHGDESGTAMTSMECPGTPGWSPLQDDCNDARPDIHSAQVEICDGVDNNCNGSVDELPAAATWYLDADDDGFGDIGMSRVSCEPQPGYVLRGNDCDDTNVDVNPGERELCDGLDNNCDGRANYSLGPTNSEDDDHDGHADIACASTTFGMGDDCNDGDPLTYPGAPEICDRRDNDCDAMVDDATVDVTWYRDLDGDTYGDDGLSATSCEPMTGYITRGGDCNTSDPEIHPGAPESCDGADDDCDGRIDEGTSNLSIWYIDTDADGVGVVTPMPAPMLNPVEACARPMGYAAVAGDCAPTSPAVLNPAWYPDADMDGYGDGTRPPVLQCTAPAGRIADATDCNDAAMAIHPTAPELCNGADDDCDMTADDGASASCVLAHATAACTGGACAIAMCSAGFDDCNTTASDGCEANLSNDAANCSMCGRACPAGAACVSGGCQALIDLAAGAVHQCALVGDPTTLRTRGARVLCWGYNAYGQVGDGSTGASVASPTQVLRSGGSILDDAISISLGNHFSCAIRVGGNVVCWGRSDHGQIGPSVPITQNATFAVPVTGVTSAVRIDAGVQHACAVTASGQVWCWGLNFDGQLGIGVNGTDEQTPVQMLAAAGTPIADGVDVAGGQTHTCIVRSGAVRASCAGQNTWGQIGDTTTTRALYATAVVGLPAGTIAELEAGNLHTCVRISGQPVYCWGSGANGQLDRGGFVSINSTPLPVDSIEMARALVVGFSHTCIAYTHSVFGDRVTCFGLDSMGQLGDGTVNPNRAIPEDVRTSNAPAYLTGVVRMIAGNDHTCAFKSDGSVVCWGTNGYAQLGRGSATPPVSPLADAPVTVVP